MIEHIELTNKLGLVLRGYLSHLDTSTELVVFFHGFTGNKSEHGNHFRDFSRELLKHNIASLRLDFSNNGESDGIFKDFTMDTLISDAIEIIDYSFTRFSKITILGYSMGGAVCSIVAPLYTKRLHKIILWSPAFTIDETIKSRYERGEKDEELNSTLNLFTLSKEMYLSTDKYNPLAEVDKINNPVLLVHGTKDLAVSYKCSEDNYQSFTDSKLHLIENAGHGYDKMSEKLELFEVTLAFILGNNR